jgi:putative spermidine/putrescine transport system substrate-binding protein
MTLTRRHFLGAGAAAGGALAMPPAFAQRGGVLNLAGASFDMRDPILTEFAKRSGATPRPWINASSQARVDRIRTAAVDCVTVDGPFSSYAQKEGLVMPIDLTRIRNWDKMLPLFSQGKMAPGAPDGFGQNPAKIMFLDEAKTKSTFLPCFFQMDSIGYNSARIPAENNTLSWGELFNPKWRGKVALYGIDYLGMLDAVLGMQALGLINPADPCNLTEKEVDTVILFLKEKKKEGHFRAMWRAYGELVNLMASEEVWIADAWWPVVVDVAAKGIPMRYAVAKEGYRAWCQGQGIAANSRNVDLAYDWLNFWLEGYAGARQGEIGYYSTCNTWQPYLGKDIAESLYEGKGRDGGTMTERAMKVYVWNTRPTNIEYYTEKWNEFLAA